MIMADTINVDVISLVKVPHVVPVINMEHPAYNVPVTEDQLLQLIQFPNYNIYEAGTKKVITGRNIDDYFPHSGGGGEGGTTDYKELSNKPSINSTTLMDNKTGSQLGLVNMPTTGYVGQVLSVKSVNASGAPTEVECTDPATGSKGDKGDKGDPGDSAYEVAVSAGYSGTKEQWLASLKGEKGDTGETGPQGPQGEKGDTGATGATGPKGDKGDKGDPGDPAAAESVFSETSVNTLQNKVITTRFKTLEGNVDTLSSNLSTTNGNVSTLSGNLTTLSNTVNTLSANLDTTNGTVSTLSNDLKTVTQDVSNITSTLNLYPENIAGVCVDYQNKKYTRLSGAIGKSAGTDFDSFPVYNSIRRCNLADDGTVNAYYGDDTYVEDGSNGQVMVEIKKVYYKMNPVKLEKASSGYGYHIRKADYFVSHQKLPGFKVHPAFVVDGVEKDVVYVAAYEGSLYDTSASAYILDDAQVADYTADKLCSIANAKPISGLSQGLTRSKAEKLSTNRGTGWHTETVQIASLIQLLMLIEYAGNIQSLLGKGVVNISDNSSYNCSSLTGSTSSLGNASGAAVSTINTKGTAQTTETANGKVSVSYRGIENPYGNIWKFITGINIYGNGSMNGGIPYICNSTTFTEDTTTGYTSAGFTVAPKGGYISAFGYGNEDYDWLFIASECSGTDSLPVGDYTWLTENLNAYRVGLLGGSWSVALQAGGFCWSLSNSSGDSYRSIGARLCKIL